MNHSIQGIASGKRRGSVLIYVVVALIALMGLASLAVDYARVRLVKTQLQVAAGAAARASIVEISDGTSSVKDAAVNVGAKNSADGIPVVIKRNDVTLGRWDNAAGTFTATGSNANAVRVTARRAAGSGGGVPLLFASVLGFNTLNLNVTVVAMTTGSSPVRVSGKYNPWLAGMPDGAYGGATVSGTAPENAPIPVTSIPVTPGSTITFQVNGSCADDPVNINQAWSPDGAANGSGIRTNDSGYLSGMSNLKTQQGSLVGVFLTNSDPTVGSTPAMLDQSTAGAMNYVTLAPALKQPFFIGDGKNSANGSQQSITVPAAATRLFLGVHDNINWDNNSGYFTVTFNSTGPARIVTVK